MQSTPVATSSWIGAGTDGFGQYVELACEVVGDTVLVLMTFVVTVTGGAVLTTVVVVVPPQPGRSVAPSPTITEIASAVLLLLKVPGEPNRGSRVSARLAARPASDQAGSISAAIEQLRGGLLSPSPRPRPRVDLDSRASALAHCLGQPNPGR